MITKLKLTGEWCLDPFEHHRKDVIEFINLQKQKTPNYKVVDVGGFGSIWSGGIVDAIVDINKVPEKYIQFNGNICEGDVWESVMEYVDKNGKFDFSICTHTLEDIAAPKFVCSWLKKISVAGFIAMPSKYAELSRGEGMYRGLIHHRWIFNHENDKVVAYPKLPFLEYEPLYDIVAEKLKLQKNDEIQWFWENDPKLELMNGDFLGPTIPDLKTYYHALLN